MALWLHGFTNLCKLIQRNFKQNIMLSNESGAKSKTDHKKSASWLQKVIQSGTEKLILFLVILIPTYMNQFLHHQIRDTVKKLLKMTTKMNHLEITQTVVVKRTFKMISKMIMNLIMQIKKTRQKMYQLIRKRPSQKSLTRKERSCGHRLKL